MGPLEKRLSFFSPLMKQTETHVVNVFVCSTEIANIFFAQNSLLFLVYSFKSRLLELNP